jgi:hypothetical protein
MGLTGIPLVDFPAFPADGLFFQPVSGDAPRPGYLL